MAEFLLLKRGRFLNFTLTLIASFFLVTTGWGQTVTTDKDDYSPGMYVVVTGAGWQPGETVSFDFHETPKVCTSDHHIRTTVARADGSIIYDQFLINEKHLGVSFVLTATGQSSGMTAVTHFTDAGIGNVTVEGTVFCVGEPLSVSFNKNAANGSQFPSNVTFIAELTNSAGSIILSEIGRITDPNGGHGKVTIDGIVPLAAAGIYKIQVRSLNPATNNSLSSDIEIRLSPTTANAGADQSDISGTSTNLTANSASVGTGKWNIISGAGGTIDNSASPTSTFTGVAGTTYVLRWTTTNGACTSTDDVTISFSNVIATSTTAASATAVYGDASVSLTASVSPLGATGSIEFFVNGISIGTSTVTSGISAKNYGLSGVNAQSYSVKANFIGTGVYGNSSSDPERNGTLTINKAASETVVTVLDATYDGSAHGGSAQVTGAGGLSESVAVYYAGTGDTEYASSTDAPVNAGTYSATATYAASANHLGSSDSKNFTINKAASETLVTVSDATYDGSAHGGSAQVTGAGGLDESVAVYYAGTGDTEYASSTDAPVNAGTYSATATYAASANHLGSSDSKNFTINKAASETVVTVLDATYDGSAHGGSAQVTGAGGLNESVAVYYAGTGDTEYASSTDAPVNAGTYSATATYAASANHLGSSDSKNFTINKATSETVVTVLDATYDGSAHGGSAQVTGAGGLNESVAVYYAGTGDTEYASSTDAPVNAGTYSATATYAASANHLGSSDSKNFTINKATSETVVTVLDATYDGSAHGGSAQVTGSGGLNESVAVYYAGTGDTEYASSTDAPVNAGTYSATATYAASANHLGSSDSKNFTINKATSETVVTVLDATYDGSAHGGSAQVTGAGGLNESVAVYYAGTGDTEYASSTDAPVNAGTYSATATYAASANHLGSSDSKNFTINKATSETVVTVLDATYDGSAHGGSAQVTGAGGLNESVAVYYAGTGDTEYASSTDAPVNAGTYSATATYAASANHLGSSDSKNFTINKATSETVVTVLDATYDGSAHGGSAQVTGAGGLNESVAVYYAGTGDTEYASSTDAPVNAGTYSATATYAASANHLGSSDSKNFTINKATSETVVTVLDATYDGSAHGGSAQVTGAGGLNESVAVYYAGTGDTEYASSTDAPVNAGTYSATATYAASANHLGSSDSKNFTINKATSETVVTVLDATYDGSAHGGSAQVTGAGGLNESVAVYYAGTGDTEYASSTDAPVNAGTYSATATYAASANHLGSSDSKNFTINKAASETVVTVLDATYDGSAHGGSAQVTGAGGLNESVAVYYAGTGDTEYASSTDAPVNAGTYSATATYAASANHLGSSDSKNFTINKATSETVVTVLDATYDGSAHGGSAQVTGSGGLNESVAVYYAGTGDTEYASSTDAPVNAGTYSATATYAASANHLGSSDSKNFTINKATSETVVTVLDATYDGSAHGGSAQVTGAGGLNESVAVYYAGTGDTEYASSTDAPVNAGTYSATATYAASANHLGSSDSKNFTINRRSITITPFDNQSKFCGQNDHTFGYTESEILLPGNTFTGKLGREAGEGVRTYTYNLGSLSAGGNYSLTLGGSAFYEIKGVAIDASASSTTVPIGPGNAPLSAVVVDERGNPIPYAAVTFTISSNAGVSIGTPLASLTNISGIALVTVDVSSLPIGVYTVKAVAGSGCADSYGYLTIYDPNSDFVTGGGWITSPAGAYVADLALSGKANFGFVAKYKKGRAEVDGNTEFQFKAGDFNFKSNFHNSGSLVVSGAKATYRGEGTVNGGGNYGFMVSAYDGAINGSSGGSDKFRIKIWDISAGNAVVYDNKLGALDNADISGDLNLALGGGSVVIHQFKANNKTAEVVETVSVTASEEAIVEILESMAVAPNPVREEARVRFSLIEDASVVLRVFDFNGREVERLFSGNVRAHEVKEVSFQRKNLMSGVYILKLTTDRGNSYDKQIIIE